MAVTRWAVESGNYAAVCFGTDYAYTVWHAQRFQRAGRWYWGASGARPGDIVFFDWGGSNSISRIDHVGIVEANLGGG
ncbi:CHAP domain-containing protein, partial [Klebsiella pneumoniae]